MKNSIKYFFGTLGLVGIMSFQVGDNILCDSKVLKERAKEMLDPLNMTAQS